MLSVAVLSAAKSLSGALLCSALTLFGCGPDEPAATAHRPNPPRTMRRPAAAPARPLPAARAVCTLTDDTLAGQPFGTEPTVQELLAAGATIAARQPFANAHEAGQTDTVLTVRHQGNTFEFYRTPDKDLLRQATVTNFQPAYGQRLRLTLDASARRNGGSCNQLRIRDTDRANNVSATFSGGQPSVARVRPYLD